MIDLSALFVCDRRSLALFRVSLAVAAMCSFLRHPEVASGINAWSLYSLSDHAWYRAGIGAITGFALLCLAFGYRTRLAGVFSWLLMASLFSGNSFAYSDPLLLALLLLGVLLPLGANFSVDQAMDSGNTPDGSTAVVTTVDDRIRTTATTALHLYIAGLLTFSAINTVWNSSSVPVMGQYLLAMSAFATAIVLLLPIRGGWLRIGLMGVFSAALLSVSTQLAQGISWMTMMVALLVFLPAVPWDKLSTGTRCAQRHQLRIYFDQPCGFCRKICFLFRTFMLLGKANIAPAQSDAEALALLQKHDSWVVYDHNGQAYVRWGALLLLLRRSPLWWPLGNFLTALGMSKWGDPLYQLIGGMRNWLSKLTALLLPYRQQRIKTTGVENWIAGAWLFGAVSIPVISLWNGGVAVPAAVPFVGILNSWLIW